MLQEAAAVQPTALSANWAFRSAAEAMLVKWSLVVRGRTEPPRGREEGAVTGECGRVVGNLAAEQSGTW